jgi:hypothetical protein
MLATVLDHWHLEKQDAADELVIHRISGIIAAFNCITDNANGKMHPTQFLGLMRALDALISDEHSAILFQIIDPDATNTIHAIAFVQMAAPVFNFRSKFRSSVLGGVYASAVQRVSKPQVAHR